MILDLVHANALVLRQKAKRVPAVTPEILRLLDDMEGTMHVFEGIGIAAPQVGESLRLAVVCLGELPVQLVNPEIVWKSDEQVLGDEGCLSLPGVRVVVPRANSIKVAFTDRDGQRQEWRLSGLDARVVQHEVDHLDGVLILDYADTATSE